MRRVLCVLLLALSASAEKKAEKKKEKTADETPETPTTEATQDPSSLAAQVAKLKDQFAQKQALLDDLDARTEALKAKISAAKAAGTLPTRLPKDDTDTTVDATKSQAEDEPEPIDISSGHVPAEEETPTEDTAPDVGTDQVDTATTTDQQVPLDTAGDVGTIGDQQQDPDETTTEDPLDTTVSTTDQQPDPLDTTVSTTPEDPLDTAGDVGTNGDQQEDPVDTVSTTAQDPVETTADVGTIGDQQQDPLDTQTTADGLDTTADQDPHDTAAADVGPIGEDGAVDGSVGGETGLTDETKAKDDDGMSADAGPEKKEDCHEKWCPCDASHCSGHGDCYAQGTEIRCKCSGGYFGEFCTDGGCETMTTCDDCVGLHKPGGSGHRSGYKLLYSDDGRGRGDFGGGLRRKRGARPLCGWRDGRCVGLDEDPGAPTTCEAVIQDAWGPPSSSQEEEPGADAWGQEPPPPPPLEEEEEEPGAAADPAPQWDQEPQWPEQEQEPAEDIPSAVVVPQEEPSKEDYTARAKTVWKKARDEVATMLASQQTGAPVVAMAVPALGVIVALIALCSCLRSKCRRETPRSPGAQQRYEKVSTAEPKADLESYGNRMPKADPSPKAGKSPKAKSPSSGGQLSMAQADRERRQQERRAAMEAKRQERQALRSQQQPIKKMDDDDDDVSTKAMKLGGATSRNPRPSGGMLKAPPKPDDPFAQIGITAAPKFDKGGRGVPSAPGGRRAGRPRGRRRPA